MTLGLNSNEKLKCFLDYTLFKEHPEFYAHYGMTNLKRNYIFSDKFYLNVVDLTRVDLATEEDKASRIDYWERLFKAKHGRN